MNRFLKILMLLTIINSTFIFSSFASQVEIDEDIDPISLDILYRNGLISLEEKEKILNNNYGSFPSLEGEKSLEVQSDVEISSSKEEELEGDPMDYNEFYIEDLRQIGQSAIKITFNQNLDERPINKSYFTLYKDGERYLNHSEYDVRVLKNDKRALVFSLKDQVFKAGIDYEIRISSYLRSAYDISLNQSPYYSYDFKLEEKDFENREVLSYEVYDEGFIDIKFKHEVSNEFLENKMDYKLTYSYKASKFMRAIKEIDLIEDDEGVSNELRLYIGKFEDKYDYTLDLSSFGLENSVFEFPGGIALSRSFGVYDMDLIDNYTMAIDFSHDIDTIGIIRLKGGAQVVDYSLYDDKLIINLSKDGGLSYLSSYSLELIDIKTKDGRTISHVSYDFSTESKEAYKDHLALKLDQARWLGDNFIEVKFNKPIKLDTNINAYMKIRDIYSKRLYIESSYAISPSTWLIKTRTGASNDKYSLSIDKLPESKSGFRSESHTIKISN